MIKDGKGGANTKSGLVFEGKVSIEKLFQKKPNYSIKKVFFSKGNGREDKYFYKILYKNKEKGYLLKKHRLYYFLEEYYHLDWKNILSKQLLPDNALYIIHQNNLNIIEIKYQEVEGSVDEKLQTCDFKKKTYQRLVSSLNWNVDYIYILNDWFKDPKYKDTLDYIISVNCRYYFNYLPLEKIGLKP